jgi:hypothetical protein
MRSVALAAALFLVAAVPAAQARKFKYTHRFVATGHLVDHWTIDEPGDCGLVGDGTVTVDFTSAKPTKAGPAIDPTHNGEPNNTLGSWVLFGPIDAFGHIGDILPKPAIGTIDLVDNTTQRPRPDGSDCGGIDKSDCGTHPLKRARVDVSGYNRKLIQASLQGVQFSYATGRRVNCGLGAVDGFGDPPALAGGNRIGDLLITMPKPSKLAHRKVVTVTKTTNKKTTSGDPGSTSYTDDYTRTVTVTFTRLR